MTLSPHYPRSLRHPHTRVQAPRLGALVVSLQCDQVEVDGRQVGEGYFVAGPGMQGRDALEVPATDGACFDFARFPVLLGDERGARLMTDHTAVGTADTGLRPVAAAAGAAEPPRPFQTALLGEVWPAAAEGAPAIIPARIERLKGTEAPTQGMQERHRRQRRDGSQGVRIDVQGSSEGF